MPGDGLDELTMSCLKAVKAVIGRPPLLVVTGAGISVDSGIPPFRGPGGLWSRYDPDLYGHIDTFRKEPELSWKMLDDIIGTSIGAKPNDAHIALARMEKRGLVGLIATQNVDGLHTLAGSKEVVELHGNARHILCPSCGAMEFLTPETYRSFDRRCSCGAVKRPDIIFFGENLPEKAMKRAFTAAGTGIPMLVVGTSGLVHPAAMLPMIARSAGATIIEINPQPSEHSRSLADHFIQASASIAVPALEKAFIELTMDGLGGSGQIV